VDTRGLLQLKDDQKRCFLATGGLGWEPSRDNDGLESVAALGTERLAAHISHDEPSKASAFLPHLRDALE